MSERNHALADRFQNRESECQPADSGDFRRNAGVDWCRSLRTTVRTKAAETVETRGHYWPLQAGTERGFIQAIAHIWQLMAALGIFCPGPRQNYGSEGWGFESAESRGPRNFLVSQRGLTKPRESVRVCMCDASDDTGTAADGLPLARERIVCGRGRPGC